MFKIDDFVQSKTGGPKMQVRRIDGDTLYCVSVSDREQKEIAVAADTVNPYHEDGDFGVC